MFRSWLNLDLVSRSAYAYLVNARNIAVKGEKKWDKPNWRCRQDLIMSQFRSGLLYANNYFCTSIYAKGEQDAITERMDKEAMKEGTKEVLVGQPSYKICKAEIIDDMTHRDGSIYKRNIGYRKIFRITERDETQIEPMMLSEPMDCFPDRERCTRHHELAMMQIFSLKLAKTSKNIGSIELYGYIAVRDCRDNLLNYVINRTRDDPIAVQKGSLMEMTGPKRGISMLTSVLVEFDMRIKKGVREDDDLQLIDGAVGYSELTTSQYPFTNRINGDCGAVDITLALILSAVEATINVMISKVHTGFSLSLSSFVFLDGLHEIQLFHGTISESCGLQRYVIAVKMDTSMHLKFKLSQNGYENGDLERCCSFEASTHGHSCRQIILELASISVKVTWSTVPF